MIPLSKRREAAGHRDPEHSVWTGTAHAFVPTPHLAAQNPQGRLLRQKDETVHATVCEHPLIGHSGWEPPIHSFNRHLGWGSREEYDIILVSS